MLANQLTQPLSKKLLISLLIVAIGEDVALYVSRNSYFMETIYFNIMLFSIVVGVKLAPLLKEQTSISNSKRKLFSNFVKAFVILYVVGIINDHYSSRVFTDFADNQSSFAEDFSSQVEGFGETGAEAQAEDYSFSDRVYEWLDSIGADFYYYFLAGLEEVWRLSYMVLFLTLFRKSLSGFWGKSQSKDGFIILAVILSSLLFGVGHSLGEEQELAVFIGTVVSYTNIGLVFGYLMITIRNLWLLVFVHGLYNVLTTMTWSYFEWTTEGFVLVILLVNMVWMVIEKNRSKVEEVKGVEL
jgi:hypothetical protein